MRAAHCDIGPTRSRGNIARTETASSRSRPALISITPSRPGVLSQLDSPVRVTDRHAPRPPNVSRPSVSDLDDLTRSGRARHLPGAWSPVAISGCIKTTPAARKQQRCSRPNGRPRRSLSSWPSMPRQHCRVPPVDRIVFRLVRIPSASRFAKSDWSRPQWNSRLPRAFSAHRSTSLCGRAAFTIARMPARTTSGSPDYPATTEAELERKGATHPVKPLTTLVGLVPLLASRFQWTGPLHPTRQGPSPSASPWWASRPRTCRFPTSCSLAAEAPC